MAACDLSSITRGLQQAAAATQHLVAQQYIKLFDQFFDYDIDDLGTPMKAKMVDVALDEQHTLRVPLVTLVAPRGLALEAMKVDLSVRMHATEQQKASHALENGELDCAQFFVTFGGDKNDHHPRKTDEMHISMEFRACDPPESIHRMIEEYTQLISPVRNDSPGVSSGAPRSPGVLSEP
ncbi:DUF2589 domain-containing protein [Pseudomonas lundensis]|uniref:DUF2589 domain-containing protein n=2 Tax=Pseudomonas TaxID=286 RepID=A0ABX4GHS5_9PSED|nr:DUF2589 domain-containing protein [Pseudomonas lundensis]NNA02493.1 DUF2589 domain-containing protein [Pseudomonas lundensis]NNA07696.1 DUF2589 domain-containing protein [Pseudomonas lundensis]NNA22679.1 DUF2589 domain-containing protein [Pseudomonas lundensis]OZY26182.1 DUF2589 domain-containing protein [Pseudomonas lundensis]